jgi:hypothetical protein
MLQHSLMVRVPAQTLNDDAHSVDSGVAVQQDVELVPHYVSSAPIIHTTTYNNTTNNKYNNPDASPYQVAVLMIHTQANANMKNGPAPVEEVHCRTCKTVAENLHKIISR